MAIAIITDWLNNPARIYAQGFALFLQYSKNPLTIALLKGGQSDYHMRRLVEELEKINSTEEIKPIVISKKELIPEIETIKPRDSQPKNRKPDFETLPEVLKDTTNLKNQYHARANHLFMKIRFCESQEDRLAMALQMLDDLESRDGLWKNLDEYRETGKIVEEKKVTLEDEITSIKESDLYKVLGNLRSALSRDRGSIHDMADGHMKKKKLDRIQTNEIKEELILKRLGNV